nr:FAD-binding protein [Roseovarius sp. MMSF_3281]
MTPQSEAELSEIVTGAKAPLRIIGGGTRPIGTPQAGDTLSTAGLSGVTLYEPGALTLVAQAGTPVEEVEAALAKEGQRLAFEPMDHRGLLGTSGTPTIGGVVAGNISGPRRVSSVGACRDSLLGVRFVDGMGRILKNGGRVMKNVTGYDLNKLMCGSWGTLGVLSEVALKVLPQTHCTGGLVIEGLSDDEAVKVLSRALATPFEVTGAAHFQKGPDGTPVTMIRVEGSDASVRYRTGELERLLSDTGTVRIEPDAGRNSADWQAVRDVAPFHGTQGDVWKLSVKPSDAPGIVARIDGGEALYDWGGGLVWLQVPQGRQAEAIRAAVDEKGGHATLVRGRNAVATFHPPKPGVEAIEAGLRQRFDPKGVFNPGLMGRVA